LLKARVLAGVLAGRSDREDAVGELVAPKLKCAHFYPTETLLNLGD